MAWSCWGVAVWRVLVGLLCRVAGASFLCAFVSVVTVAFV